jgi:hypothetical protein
VAKLTLTFTPFQSDIRGQMPADKKPKGPHAMQYKVDKLAVPFHVSVPAKLPINWH